MTTPTPNTSNSLEERLSDWILNNRALIIILSIIILIANVYGAKFLTLTADQRAYFGEDNPQLISFDLVEENFTETNNVFFMLESKEGKFFTKENIDAIEELTDLAWQMPYVTRVDSLSNYQHTKAEDDDLIVDYLTEFAPDDSQASYDYLEQIAINDPAVYKRLISEDRKVAGVNVSMVYTGDEQVAPLKGTEAARELRDLIEKKYPNLDIRITGNVLINAAMVESSREDMATLVPAMYVVIVVLMTILLRSVTAVIATVIMITFSAAAAMGVAGYISISLTPHSLSASTIIMTIVVAHCVHILVTYMMQLQHGNDRMAAMREALRINIQPVFLTSLTTAIGFLSLNFSDVPPQRDMGNIVAIGVGYAMVFCLGLLPALVSYIPIKVKVVKEDNKNSFDKLADFVIKRKTPLLYIFMLVGVAGSYLATHNVINDQFTKYFSEDLEFRRDADFADRTLAGLYSIEYLLESGESYGVTDPEYLKTVEAFANWLGEQPEVKHVSAFTDVMKRLNKNMNGDDESFYRLPESKELASQYLLLYEMSLPYGLDLNTSVNQGKSATRLSVTLPSLNTTEFIDLQNRATDWLSENAPEAMYFEGASMALMFTHLGFRAMKSSIEGAAVALIIISGIILIALKSIRLGILSLVPNLLPAAIGFGAWALISGDIGLSLASALGITMGIVVDDTVHFLSKYRRAAKELNLNSEDAVRYAFKYVGKALFVTTLVLVMGFMMLGLSTFQPSGAMGIMVSLIIFSALILDFLLLPPLLLLFGKKRSA